MCSHPSDAPLTQVPAAAFPSVTVVLPTYREADNLPHLVERLDRLRRQHGLELELFIMDDDSQDGTVELIEALSLDWVRLVVRKENRGLSPAVIDGLRLARHETIVVMDADLSHPPEKIPELLAALEAGAEMAIGSRNVAGGSTDAQWGLFRWLNSRLATLLARPLTNVRDPMAGFFALKRDRLNEAAPLNPVGYKIGLELIVKCGFRRIVEVPIHFTDRQHGQSKLTVKQQLQYLQHLWRLFTFRHANASQFLQFAMVGLSGVVVNLAALTVLEWSGVPVGLAVGLAIAVAMLSNFVLNRRFTFSYARGGSVWWQLVGFVGVCSLGAVANYLTTMAVLELLPPPLRLVQLAALAGITVGMFFNFLVNRALVFRRSPGESATPRG